MTDTLVIHHAKCWDGIASAYIVKNYFRQGILLPKETNCYTDIPDVKGHNVIMVDYSYPKILMDKIIQLANNVLIIDHHQSAIPNLIDYIVNIDNFDYNTFFDSHNKVACIFDINHSAVMLTHKVFNKDLPVPKLFEYIEDRDLWIKKYPESDNVVAALSSYSYCISTIRRFIDNSHIKRLNIEGSAIVRKQLLDINCHIKNYMFHIHVCGYRVPAINCPKVWVSDIGSLMAKNNPFAVCYYDTQDGKRKVSLRSTPEGIDVCEIAKRYGGGGHRNAASFMTFCDWYGD